MNEENNLAEELKIIANEVQVSPDFADGLEKQLREIYAKQHNKKIVSPYRWVAVSIITLCIGVIAFLPTTHAFARNIMSFFFPTDGETIYVDTSNERPIATQVDSIAEAEVIAGFNAFEWIDETFELRWIFAAKGIINLVYEQGGGDRGNLILVSQVEVGLRSISPFNAVPPETRIIPIVINGFSGEYVEGYWFSFAENDRTEFEWVDNHFRQLHWVTDDYDFHVLIAHSLVANAEEAVEIAETLRVRP